MMLDNISLYIVTQGSLEVSKHKFVLCGAMERGAKFDPSFNAGFLVNMFSPGEKNGQERLVRPSYVGAGTTMRSLRTDGTPR